jgi:hypothetical protein
LERSSKFVFFASYLFFLQLSYSAPSQTLQYPLKALIVATVEWLITGLLITI